MRNLLTDSRWQSHNETLHSLFNINNRLSSGYNQEISGRVSLLSLSLHLSRSSFNRATRTVDFMHDTCLQYRNSPSESTGIPYIVSCIQYLSRNPCIRGYMRQSLYTLAHLSEKFTRKFLADAVSLKCLDLKLLELNTVRTTTRDAR